PSRRRWRPRTRAASSLPRPTRASAAPTSCSSCRGADGTEERTMARAQERGMARDAPIDDPCRVLVVDDETNLRAVLKGLLVRDGYAVDEAADGAQGLARARATNYAAVITDLR